MEYINILHTACERCLIKPPNAFTIKDIWKCFGENWDLHRILPTLELNKLEKLAICISLKENNYSQFESAKTLGITPKMINDLLRKYHIKSDKYRVNKPKQGERDIKEIIEKGDLYEWIGIE